MWENARYLASRGHSVTFLAASYRGAKRSEEIDGINVERIGSLHLLWLRSFIYYLTHARGRFDVVVTEGFGGSRVPRFAPLYVQEPVITEWHQVHRELFAAQYPWFMQLPLNLLELATAWVHRKTALRVGTEDWRFAFGRLGFRADRIYLVPVSVRDDWVGSSPSKPVHDPTIIWIGKFRRYKCPDHAIRSMVKVIERVPSARLLLVGRHDDRKYEAELEALVTELGLSSIVTFEFNVSEDKKKELIAKSRVLVLPSAVEGFGLVVLEANALGLPVVASTGVPEGAVRDHFNGLRYPYGQTDRLSDALLELLSNIPVYDELSSNAINFAAGFSWSRVGAMFEEMVEQVAVPATTALGRQSDARGPR